MAGGIANTIVRGIGPWVTGTKSVATLGYGYGEALAQVGGVYVEAGTIYSPLLQHGAVMSGCETGAGTVYTGLHLGNGDIWQ